MGCPPLSAHWLFNMLRLLTERRDGDELEIIKKLNSLVELEQYCSRMLNLGWKKEESKTADGFFRDGRTERRVSVPIQFMSDDPDWSSPEATAMVKTKLGVCSVRSARLRLSRERECRVPRGQPHFIRRKFRRSFTHESYPDTSVDVTITISTTHSDDDDEPPKVGYELEVELPQMEVSQSSARKIRGFVDSLLDI